jgi:hypothetical protein
MATVSSPVTTGLISKLIVATESQPAALIQRSIIIAASQLNSLSFHI